MRLGHYLDQVAYLVQMLQRYKKVKEYDKKSGLPVYEYAEVDFPIDILVREVDPKKYRVHKLSSKVMAIVPKRADDPAPTDEKQMALA